MAEQKKETFSEVKKADQYRTVDELMERSKPSSAYYTLLVLSSFIVAAGLLVGNAAIVIGGMLVTPVLTPLLLISLGVSIGDLNLVRRISRFVGKSLLIVAASAFFLGIVFGVNGTPDFFMLDDTLRGAMLYFIVAIAAGFAATFAWARKEMSEVLPGVAIAVSLVPPLALIGIGFSIFSFTMIRYNFFVFFFNLLGVLIGSLLVFSMLKFYKVEKKVEQEVQKQEQEEQNGKK